jgi:hypothetical protein
MVLVPCGCLSDKMDAAAWEEAVARARKAVLARLKSDLGESAEHHLHRRNGSNDTSEPRGVDGDECPATGIVDLEQHIKFEERMTPQARAPASSPVRPPAPARHAWLARQGWADRFHLHKGSCFGLSHTFTQLGYLR